MNSSAPPNDEAVSPSFLLLLFSISHRVVLFFTKPMMMIHTKDKVET